MLRTAVYATVLFSAGLVLPPATAQAQSANPAWLDRLSEQLANEQECAVDYYLNIREGELAGRLTFEARAQCADGRQFDAALTEPAERFTVSECGVQVC